jgi:hypothetical protein
LQHGHDQERTREVEGEPEIWTNLGDVLHWLDSLPEHTNHRIAAEVALEIREMLFNSVKNAEFVTRPEG